MVLLLFVFCAMEFRAIHKSQKASADQVLKLSESLQQLPGVPKGARARATVPQTEGPEKTMESLSMDLQNFMKEMRSRQTGYERKLSDLDERLNRERETILADLRSFLEDMRLEKQEFGKEIDRLRQEFSSLESSRKQEIEALFAKIEERVQALSKMIEDAVKRNEEIYRTETEGIKIQNQVSGPGADTRS